MTNIYALTYLQIKFKQQKWNKINESLIQQGLHYKIEVVIYLQNQT